MQPRGAVAAIPTVEAAASGPREYARRRRLRGWNALLPGEDARARDRFVIGLLQRVRRARITVDGEARGEIGRGLLVLAAVERGDTGAQARRLAERIVNYRVFPDGEGRMNLSLKQIGGELLLAPQFTLAADTGKGTRPGFSKAAPPGEGRRLFERLVAEAEAQDIGVRTGVYGADMDVELVNSGPVTFLLQVRAKP